MNKTIAIIPARGNSKRLPGKNLLPLGGIPLIAHSILYAQANSETIDAVYVSTDCEQIKNVALEYGAKVIDRPVALSGHLEPTVSALKHVLENIEIVDSVILLQPTNPLRPVNLLKEAFENYTHSNVDSLFTVTRNHQKFGKIMEGRYMPFNYKLGQRSQDLDPLYFENGLLYISKADLILRDIILSELAIPFIIDHPFAKVDIDTQEDFDFAEYVISRSL
ncbi:acylneuraminate cytidylyltransferase family protein [Flavobacterium ardleyense]|uniref:acylneuraminate cytidylyltransferase family protein n=1 Tax=Flavobacterium ardleyense TaxID=2038737 RepID=UPI00298C8E10|nr:acylneuraminate cytidylyltransferase family protein [Flavobacterium ardleyense]